MPKSTQIFPIVGIGASAGGINSFKKFLSSLTEDSGMAYVLLQHLDPSHHSSLPDILSKTTDLPVHMITDGMEIRPNNVYVLPENKMLTVANHTLKLTPRDTKKINLPIDTFLKSLAEVHKTMAAGVVLSGTANDGTAGLKYIKEQGGITFAESPNTAAWKGMPKSAIASGAVDFELDVEAIVQKLLQINLVYKNTRSWEEEKLPEGQEDAFRQILSLIRIKSNIDFNYYKQSTLKRRISRRMGINQTDSLHAYLEFLRDNKSEQDALLQDMLIQVTSFFRDEKAFNELEDNVIPKLLQKRSNENGSIRIWVAGCATGEEAYSFAILLHEALEVLGSINGQKVKKIQIFATDVSTHAIEKARQGIFNSMELKHISESRLRTYFTKINSEHKVNKFIRDLVIFAPHNFLKDPPFAKMDFISCRNVFIYMDTFLQKKAMTTFHYALRDGGFLFLGSAETVGASAELFVPVSKHNKIYSRKKGIGRFVPSISTTKTSPSSLDKVKDYSVAAQPDFRKSAEQVLMARHTPPNVIVDDQMDVVQINGVVTPFLEPPSGKPTFNLMKMAQEGLGFELRNAIHKAKSGQVPITKEDISVRNTGNHLLVTIDVIPLTDTVEPHYLILFHKKSASTPPLHTLWKKFKGIWAKSGKNELQSQNTTLRNELSQAREDMRSISEDQEATNEELQSANEELLSSNEEMQSLNEELETSKEELQSTNEELIIINRELLERQEELNGHIEYTEAILATLRESLVVLDKNLNVSSANRAFFEKFGSTLAKVEGVSFLKIQDERWSQENLEQMLRNVLPQKESMNNFEHTLSKDNHESVHLLLNARELVDGRKADKRILLAIEDITERKLAVNNYIASIAELEKTNEQLDQFVNVASHDLQEPLRKILTFADRIHGAGEHLLTENMGTYLSKMEDAAKRMSTLIQDLLNYSRTAHHEEQFEETDLNEIIKQLIPDFEILVEESKAEISVSELPKIHAIPLQMRQLFHNLISNGLKFAKKDVPPKIDISVVKLKKEDVSKYATLDKNRSYVKIQVKDEGIGLDQKYGEQIFTIFQRLHQPREYKGTGIGLALVRRVVANHDGKIFVTSTIGEGAEFHIILPVDATPK